MLFRSYRSEKQFDTIAFFDEEKNNLGDVLDAINVLKELIVKPGVLNQYQIKKLVSLNILIYEPNHDNIEPASYDLSLSQEHFNSGIDFTRKSKIDIAPLDFVIVRAKESANIPSNICGNFDLRVNMFCKGIILSNGPQIDPGYMGRFLCLLYNASSKNYNMEENKTFSTVVFQSLSATSKRYKGTYQRKESIQDYVTPYAETTISTNMQMIQDIKNKQEDLKKKNLQQEEAFRQLNLSNNSIKTEISDIEKKLPWFSSSVGFSFGILSLIISFAIGYIFTDLNKDVGFYKSEIERLTQEQSAFKTEILKLQNLAQEQSELKKDILKLENLTMENSNKLQETIQKQTKSRPATDTKKND